MDKHIKKKSAKKKKSLVKSVIKFLAFELVFTMVTLPLLLIYGPFETPKRMYVGAAMSSANHKYLATIFLSNDKIDKIIHENAATTVSASVNNEEIDKSLIKIDNSHSDKVEKSIIKHPRYDGYIITIADPKRVKVGYTNKLGKEGERTSQIAEDHNAIAAINGGAFSDKTGGSYGGTGSIPAGILMVDGKVVYQTVKDDEKISTLAFDANGTMYVSRYSINDLNRLKIKDATSFEIPGLDSILMINGKSLIKGDGGAGPAPRTAIGQKKDGSIVMVVIDGRGASGLTKMGATLGDLVEIMKLQGVQNAMNLDGGSSSTMYYDGEVINNPSDWSGERTVNNAVYVTP